jgi:hypothetical protein
MRRLTNRYCRRENTKAEGACQLAEPWFLGQGSRQPPVAQIDGQPVLLDAAIVMAADLLRNANSPLIYGLSRSSTEGHSASHSPRRRRNPREEALDAVAALGQRWKCEEQFGGARGTFGTEKQ